MNIGQDAHKNKTRMPNSCPGSRLPVLAILIRVQSLKDETRDSKDEIETLRIGLGRALDISHEPDLHFRRSRLCYTALA